MKSIISIVITGIYLAFSVGLTVHIHQCEDTMDVIVELPKVENLDSCHDDDSHACCETSATDEASCCSGPSTGEEHCFDSHLFIQLQAEQVISKKLVIATHPEFQAIVSSDLSCEYHEEVHNKDVITHPPPIEEQKHILYCSFILYG